MFLYFFWDYDGTLFDSYPHMTKAFDLALRDSGIKRPYDKILSSIKHSLAQCIGEVVEETGIEGEKLLERFKYHDGQNYEEEVYPFPFAAEVCRSIVQKGGKNFLYTHSGKHTWEMLKKYGFDTVFCDGITSEQNFPLKPAPDALLHLIQKHGLAKEQCIMVGDRDIDLLAGFHAGISGCLFDPDGYFSRFDAPYRINSLREIEEKLLK